MLLMMQQLTLIQRLLILVERVKQRLMMRLKQQKER